MRLAMPGGLASRSGGCHRTLSLAKRGRKVSSLGTRAASVPAVGQRKTPGKEV